MSSITLSNQTLNAKADFRIYQGTDQIARVNLNPGSEAGFGTGNIYKLQASTTVDGLSVTSAPITLSGSMAHLLAEVVMEQPSLYSFRLRKLDGASKPYALALESTWRSPVIFNIWKDQNETALVKVLDNHNVAYISTEQKWAIKAVVDGITTLEVETTNPDAIIEAVENNNDRGFSLRVR